MKKALILGGGFAGVQAAIELQKKDIFEVTLVSDRDYLYLYPISIWIPIGEKFFDDVKVPLVSISDAFGFHLLIDNVVEIKSSENKVFCSEHIFEYDYLVIIMSEKGKTDRKSYFGHLNILCIMDSGNGAAFVFRNDTMAFTIPMPLLGHWVKRGWGKYAKLTKKGIIPRIPGL
jgi:hypothetical protein